MVEKVLFWGQIFEVKILMDLHALRFPQPQNQNILRLVYVSVISVTQKQIIAETRNLLFYISIMAYAA